MSHSVKPEHLRKKILSNPLSRAVFSFGGEVYLVGGFIRDILSTGRSRDLDFVVFRGLERTVDAASRRLGGTMVRLKKEKLTRIVLKDGTTLDFSRIANDILTDLRCRDFTVNAMAWSPQTGLIDPLGGMKDLGRGIIRGIGRKNFLSDPVRMMRAYRFSAEKSWKIEFATRKTIRELAPEMKRPATERITLELFKTLNSRNPFTALSQCLQDGILERIISLSYKKLRNNLKLISSIDEKPNKIPEMHHFKDFIQGLNPSGVIRLEGLLLGSSPDENRLSLSNDLLNRTETANKYLKDFAGMDRLDRGGLFELFHAAEKTTPDLLVLACKSRFLKDYGRFLRIMSRGLMASEEIMSRSGLREGPKVGKIIRDMKKMQFEGLLKRKREAIRWLSAREC